MNEPKPLITEWAQVPHGLFLIRMFHERYDRHVLHVGLKTSDEPWHDQPHAPFYSETITGHEVFWNWAKANLPIYDYPHPLKAS